MAGIYGPTSPADDFVVDSFGVRGPAGPSPLAPIESWTIGVVYVPGPPASYVTYLGASYACIRQHTSSAANPPAIDSPCWRLVSGSPVSASPGGSSTAGLIGSILCAEPVVSGLPVVVDKASKQLRAARADTYARAVVLGLAASATVVGFVAQVLVGPVVLGDWTAVTGATDLAPGALYFLAPAGRLTVVPPVGQAGVSIVAVGRAADARTLLVAPVTPILQ